MNPNRKRNARAQKVGRTLPEAFRLGHTKVWKIEELGIEDRDAILGCHELVRVSWRSTTERWGVEGEWRLVLSPNFFTSHNRDRVVTIPVGAHTTTLIWVGKWVCLVEAGNQLNYSALDKRVEFGGRLMSTYLTACIPPDERG